MFNSIIKKLKQIILYNNSYYLTIDRIIYIFLYPLFLCKSKFIFINSTTITYKTCNEIVNIFYSERNFLIKKCIIFLLYIFNLQLFNNNIYNIRYNTYIMFYHDNDIICREDYTFLTDSYSDSIHTIYINSNSVQRVKSNSFINCKKL